MKRVQESIFINLTQDVHTPSNAKPIYIDGVRYRSLFVAGIDSDISYYWLSKKMAETNGGPISIKGKIVVSEEWLKTHPEYLI